MQITLSTLLHTLVQVLNACLLHTGMQGEKMADGLKTVNEMLKDR